MDRKTKFLMLLVFMVLILLLIVAWRFRETGEEQVAAPPARGTLSSSKPINKLEELAADEALPGFPQGEELPMPKSATVLKVYQATAPDGRVQVTKLLVSPKSAQENFEYFHGVLSNPQSGWKIISTLNQASDLNHKAIFAQNEEGMLNVNITAGDEAGQTTIDLSFLLKQ